MDSPVPASMFAPEPSSPGAARAAAAAARLHDGFDSDCSEDGEALNGEPELDLTSKVGPGAGGSAKWDPAARGLRGRPSRLLGDGGGGRGQPAYLPVRAARGSRAMGGPRASRPPPPPPSFSPRRPPASRRPAPGEITTPRLRHVELGCLTPAAPYAVSPLPRPRGTLSLDCPWQPRVGGGLGRGSGGAGGTGRPRGSREAFLVSG